MKQKYLEILTKCTLFREIDEADLNTMLECLKPKVYNFKKDDIITTAGEKFYGIGIVLSGEVTVTKENAAGDRIIMSILKPGELFGEMAAFSGKRVWPATVTAQGRCSVMFLPPEKILGECKKLCPSHRRLLVNMLEVISNKALLLNRKVEYLSVKNLRGKIANFLIEQFNQTGKNTFMLSMKRNELADFLNVSRPSLSREMCRMRDEGVIEFHRSSIQIKNINALRAMAE